MMPQVNDKPAEATTTADTLITYASYSASPIFQLVLFFLALWVGVQCFRSTPSTSGIGARRLRLILVEGNALYFVAWVQSPCLSYTGTDTHRLLIYQAIFLVVMSTTSVGHYLSHETPNLRTLVASICYYFNEFLGLPAHNYRLSARLAYSSCIHSVVFYHACLTKEFERTELFNHSLSWSNYLWRNPIRITSISTDFYWWYYLLNTSVVGPLSYFISLHTKYVCTVVVMYNFHL